MSSPIILFIFLSLLFKVSLNNFSVINVAARCLVIGSFSRAPVIFIRVNKSLKLSIDTLLFVIVLLRFNNLFVFASYTSNNSLNNGFFAQAINVLLKIYLSLIFEFLMFTIKSFNVFFNNIFFDISSVSLVSSNSLSVSVFKRRG